MSPRARAPCVAHGASSLDHERRLMRGLRALAGDQPLRMRVLGECMAPLARDGELVEIAPARFYWPGDVIAFRRVDGTFVVHRLVGYRPRFRRLALVMITQGDQCASWDAPLSIDQVIGKIRGGECSPLLVTVPLRHRLRTIVRFAGLASARLLLRLRRGLYDGGWQR